MTVQGYQAPKKTKQYHKSDIKSMTHALYIKLSEAIAQYEEQT